MMVLKEIEIWSECGPNEWSWKEMPYGLILIQSTTQWSWKEMVLKEVAMYKIVDNFANNRWIWL